MQKYVAGKDVAQFRRYVSAGEGGLGSTNVLDEGAPAAAPTAHASGESDGAVSDEGAAAPAPATSAHDARVYRHYKLMRTHQTLAFAQKMERKWGAFDHAHLTIREAFDKLDGYVDSSDPDNELPNVIHALQTAEGIRSAGEPDWMVLIGLLHDMGKIMFLWGDKADGQEGTADGDQWALGGDTFVVGARLPDCLCLPELNALNPDMRDARYNTPNGVYAPGCGLANLKFAWGHDEYMYRLLTHPKNAAACARIPAEGLAMVRYHSCYAWHTGGAYAALTDAARGDDAKKAWVLRFNQYDLYTKADKVPVLEELWPYYQGLIDKYCPGRLWW